MPTYEYRCPDGHDFERFLKMSEATDVLACPVCEKVATRRISGGAGLVFKGSGFYITDYGKDGKKDQQKPAAEDAKPAPATPAAPAAPSTATPAPTSSTKTE